MKCKKCGAETEIKKHGIMDAYICTECGSFSGWVTKKPIKEERITNTEPCYYCTQTYVIPKSWDGGIVGWENVDNLYCPICGRRLK
jgi:hypothetical protein